MGGISFDTGDYVVSVSTHGYFRVVSRTTPSGKFTSLPGTLYSGQVSELGHGIRYSPGEDDVIPDIEDPIVETACQNWVARHALMLAEAEREAAAEWVERQKQTFDYGGHTFRVGQRVVISSQGHDWQTATLLDITPDRMGATVVIQDDHGGVGSLIVGQTGNAIRPAIIQ